MTAMATMESPRIASATPGSQFLRPAGLNALPNPRSVTVSTEVTPQLAQLWLKLYPFENQRDPIQSAIMRYSLHMEQEERGQEGFFESEIIFGYCAQTGSLHLLDGQQRLSSCVKARKVFPARVTVIHYETREEMREHYARMDTGWARSFRQILKATKLAERMGLNARVTEKSHAGLMLVLRGFLSDAVYPFRRDPQLAAVLMENWKSEIQTYWEIVAKAESAIRIPMERSAVTALGLILLRHAPDKGKEFLNLVVGDNETKGSPVRALVKFLLTHKIKGSGTAKSGRGLTDYPSEQYARFCAAAWNAWYQGRDLTVLRETLEPIILVGTPYKSGTVVFYDPWKADFVTRAYKQAISETKDA